LATAGLDWTWKLRNARLSAMPEANQSYVIRWRLANPEVDTMTVSAFFDNDAAGTNGVAIGSVTAAAGAGQLTWNTAGVTPAEYYVYICADDGWNTLCRYGDVPVLIRH
jgi:hypothetical protein